MFFLNFIILFVTLVVGMLTTYIKWKFSYWYHKGVPYIEPTIPFGTAENPFRRKHNIAITIQKYYHHFKALNSKYGGLYTSVRPTLLVVDPELIKNVISKDFSHFSDRGMYFNEKTDPLSANLVKMEGQKWRSLRAKLTPTFSSGKLKMMLPALVECTTPLREAVGRICQSKEHPPIDIKNVLACFTTDVIGSCAFGIDCNSFTDPESDFRKHGRAALDLSSKLRAVKGFVAFAIPSLARRLGLSLTDPEVERFFINVVSETVRYRRDNQVVRNDFLQLAMDLKKDNDGSDIPIAEIAAQAFVFFVAGFETSSTTMTFCLYELARNQDVQDRVRDDVNEVLLNHQGILSYEALMDMKYLTSVIDETLRKYPPIPLLPRVCVKDYQIPGTNIVVNKGSRVIVPIYALQNDPEWFPNPEKFDPDRFNDRNKSSVTPFTYMPFGEGPRICIGLRFGLLQAKVGLVALLRDFRFMLSEKTQQPIEFVAQSTFLTAKGGIWLNIEKVNREET